MKSMQLGIFFWLFVAGIVVGQEPSKETDTNRNLFIQANRIVMLGDSITHAGEYVAHLEAWLLTQELRDPPTIINLGLPSETVSGLSEEGHAGGNFPRPVLSERLDRVLKLTKPDLVIACYGMNCGIYQPWDEGRFAKYREGITSLKAAVEKQGGKLILMTPATYDDQIGQLPFSYNEVLDKYSQWLLDQREEGWQVIDLHFPMSAALRHERMSDPNFTFQPDAVHPNATGHTFIARQIIAWLGDREGGAISTPTELLTRRGWQESNWKSLQQRQQIRRDAYVSAAGHKRPGMSPGLPLAEAETKVAEITAGLHK